MSDSGWQPLVVVGVDGSDVSNRAVSWAAEYAARNNARVRLVAAWETPMLFGRPVSHDGYEPVRVAHEAVEKAAVELDLPDDRIETLVPVGRPGTVLLDCTEDADLLVVGCRGHRTFETALLGSTSAYCVHHSRIPVVVVR